MSLIDTVFSPRILLGITLYTLAIVLLEWAAALLLKKVEEVRLNEWMVEHLALPLTRVLALLIFLFTAYPTLYGIEAAPRLSTLLDSGDGRVMDLINLAFVIGLLLLPLLPVIGLRTTLILPVQGIALSALLFGWMSQALGIQHISYWPGVTSFLAITAIALITPLFASLTGRVVGEWLESTTGREGFAPLTYDSLVLLFQLPSILIYTLALGKQL